MKNAGNTSDSNLNVRYPITLKLVIAFNLVLILAGWRFTSYLVEYGEEQERRNLVALAVTASASIDPKLIEFLDGTPADAETVAWFRMRRNLARIHEATSDARFVYIMALRGGKLVFLADAEPEDSADYSAPGDIYEEASPELLGVFYDAKPFVEGPVSDRWGIWVSGHAPIVDPETKKVVAVMGIDIDARQWRSNVVGYRMLGLSISALVFLGSILFSFTFFLQIRSNTAISALNAKLLTELAERRRVQDSLLLLEKAVNTMKVGMVFRDCDNIVRYINPADAAMHGYKAEDIIGKEVSVLGTPGSKKPLSREELKKINTWERERINLRLDGTAFPVHLISDVVLNEEGEPLGVITTCEDITERKAMEQALIEAKEAAEAASRAKSDFLASMSHELRTPLNGILGLTELALDTELSPSQRERLTMVSESARMLLHIINDILDFSKIEAGKFELEIAPFDLGHVLRSVVEPLGVVARNKGLTINLDVAEGIPPYLVGDSGRLRQMLYNLLGNAVKFTAQGGCSVRVEPCAEDAGPGRVCLLFAITDTGIGIPREKQEMIFGKFSQADQSVSRKFGGTGLGLAISKSIATMMGGRIWVESEDGKGSTFLFTAIFGEAQAPPETIQAIPESTDVQVPLHILLAEDNMINQIVAKAFLERDGHSVRIAENGHQVLDILAEEPFDLILMDVEMPEMDGIEATRIIREEQDGKFNPAIPIVALTAHAMAGYSEKLISAGMDYYLSKPVVQADVRAALKKVMAGRMALSELVLSRPEVQGKADDRQVLDMEGTLVRLEYDLELFDRMRRVFEQEAPAKYTELGQAIEKNDAENARLAAHSFKNMALVIGAPSLSDSLLWIEELCREGDLKRAAELFETLSDKLSAVLKALETCS